MLSSVLALAITAKRSVIFNGIGEVMVYSVRVVIGVAEAALVVTAAALYAVKRVVKVLPLYFNTSNAKLTTLPGLRPVRL